jgi:hypothetical protein
MPISKLNDNVVNPDDDVLKLKDDTYRRESEWARRKKISQRTSWRHRNRDPGLPYLEWGGEIWIGDRQGDEYIAQFIRQRNTRRKTRKAGAV